MTELGYFEVDSVNQGHWYSVNHYGSKHAPPYWTGQFLEGG